MPDHMVGTSEDLITYLALHRFDGGVWEFHATDAVDDDPAPTHVLIAIENLREL